MPASSPCSTSSVTCSQEPAPCAKRTFRESTRKQQTPSNAGARPSRHPCSCRGGTPRNTSSATTITCPPSSESGEPFTFSFSAEKIGDDLRITQGGAQLTAAAVRHGEGLRVFIGANAVDIAFPDPLSGALGHHSAEGSLTAPMPGVITLLKAAPGDSVEAGATLLVMEAMKMEHAIKAPHDGVIKSFRFKAGDQVKDGDLLVEFEESA